VSFTPIIPTGGSAGWAFLQRTRESQQAAFDKSTVVQRDTDYFEENIGKINSAEELVGDYRLLKVALGAFGLDDDIGNKFFMRKVLEEGTLDPEAFSNKLSDKRYRAMSNAFGFEYSPPRSKISDFGAKITAAYRERQFEVAVGEQDQNLRLVMGFERDLTAITKSATTEDSMWFSIMANKPLRSVFESAFRLPTAVGTLDIDRQLDIFKQKSAAFFGTTDPKDFLEEDTHKELTRRFLIQADLDTGITSTSPGSIALTLLQSVQSPYPSLFG
jgi:hypothetical protein